MSINRRIMDEMLVKQFGAAHRDYYDENEREQIINSMNHSNWEENYTADGIREIMDELGLIPDEKNMYIAFIDLIDKEFGLEGKNIVEVGGGILPRLARRIHSKQANGTITVYDPKLGIREEGNERLILKKEPFKRNTPIEGTDLLIGLMPCQGTEPLIEAAIQNKIDFIIWLCEGGNLPYAYDISVDDWIHGTISVAERDVKENGMGKLMIKRLPNYSDYPIVYNQR